MLSTGEDTGAAYVFRWDGAAWAQETELPGDFGAAAALVADTAFLTNPRLFASDPKFVYAYVRDGDTWSGPAKMPVLVSGASECYTLPLSADGDRLVAGVPLSEWPGLGGAVAVFERDDGGTPAYPSTTNGSRPRSCPPRRESTATASGRRWPCAATSSWPAPRSTRARAGSSSDRPTSSASPARRGRRRRSSTASGEG
jgi:hypothetical protein